MQAGSLCYFATRRLKRYLKPILPVAPRTLRHDAAAQCSIGFQPVSRLNLNRRACAVGGLRLAKCESFLVGNSRGASRIGCPATLSSLLIPYFKLLL
jgi:hypothetical protein